MASTIKIKRSSTPGNAPNNSNIEAGELAINTADRIMYSSDGSLVFEIGANLTSQSVGDLTITGTITAGGGVGSAGQVLTSNGTGVEWTTSSGSGDVLKVGTPVDNQVGVWTGDGTIEGDANLTWDGSIFDVNGSVAISTGLYDSANTLGTDGQVLTSNGTAIIWEDIPVAETVYTLSGSANVSLSETNGGIQVHTLTDDTDYFDAMTEGESITLRIPATSFTITLPGNVVWINNGGVQPTLSASANTMIGLQKEGSNINAVLIGDGT